MRRLIWVVIIALGGGGIFYALHPKAKSCQELVETANVASDAANNFQSGQSPDTLLSTFTSTANKLNSIAGSLASPFNSDAQNLSQDLNSVVSDVNSGDGNAFVQDVQTYNSLASKVNGDCKAATGG